MNKTAGKPNRYSSNIWFTSILIFFVIFLFFNSILYSQCSDSGFFKKKISHIYSFSTKKNSYRLQELLSIQKQMKECHLENDSSFMFLLQKMGVLYFNQHENEKAINFTTQSINIAKNCIINKTCKTLALVDNYSNLRYYYESTNQTFEKYTSIDSCIFYSLKGNNGFDLSIPALEDKTEYLFNKGEYSLSSKNAKLGIDITQKYFHGKDSILYIVFFTIKLADALYLSKDTSTAKYILESQIPLFIKNGNSNQLYAFYSLLGTIYKDRKENSIALSYFQKAYKLSILLKYNSGCSENLIAVGNLYSERFYKYDTALKYCFTALKYAGPADTVFIFREIGKIYGRKEMYDKSQYYFQKAFNSIKQGINETTILQSSFQFPGFNELQYLSDLITSKADSYLLQYYHTKNDSYLKKAIEIYKKSDLFLAKVKTEQQLQLNSNLVWRTTARNLYEHAIEACYTNNNTEDAFYFFEKSRAILLNDQINQQRWMTEADIAKQAALKKVTVELEKKLVVSSHEQPDRLTTRIQLYTASEALSALTKSIQIKNPSHQKKNLDTSFLTIPQLRDSVLTNSKTLIEIFAGDSALYLLTIAPNTLTFNKINLRVYDSLTSSFNSFIKNPVTLNKQFPAFVKTAHQLYRLLFPLNNPPPGSLIISPDGESFPFEALVMNENPQQPDYLLNHYATSYAYSIKHLINQFSSKSKTNNTVLGIAPVEYKNFPQLATLSGSDISLKKINDYYGSGTNFIKKNATYNNFLKHFPDYTIIQLYTHAADDSATNNPVIYFADSVISLSDLILDRKPTTQLVILSACETANGKLYKGEGIFNFNRAFAAMGIPAAISNLWSVADKSTYRITELFYKYLAEGLPTDIALQKAKMDFVKTAGSKEQTLPYYWAGIILTGKVDVLKNNTETSWRLLTCIGIGILLASYAGLKIYRAKRKKYIARQYISK